MPLELPGTDWGGDLPPTGNDRERETTPQHVSLPLATAFKGITIKKLHYVSDETE